MAEFASGCVRLAAENLRPSLAEVLPGAPDLGECVWEECSGEDESSLRRQGWTVVRLGDAGVWRFVPADLDAVLLSRYTANGEDQVVVPGEDLRRLVELARAGKSERSA